MSKWLRWKSRWREFGEQAGRSSQVRPAAGSTLWDSGLARAFFLGRLIARQIPLMTVDCPSGNSAAPRLRHLSGTFLPLAIGYPQRYPTIPPATLPLTAAATLSSATAALSHSHTRSQAHQTIRPSIHVTYSKPGNHPANIQMLPFPAVCVCVSTNRQHRVDAPPPRAPPRAPLR